MSKIEDGYHAVTRVQVLVEVCAEAPWSAETKVASVFETASREAEEKIRSALRPGFPIKVVSVQTVDVICRKDNPR